MALIYNVLVMLVGLVATATAHSQDGPASSHQQVLERAKETAEEADELWRNGEHEEARATIDELISSLPEDCPPETVLEVKDLLAQAAFKAADHPTARSLWESAYEQRLETLPDDHLELQKARANLALALKSLGQLEEAEALERRALEVFTRTLPDDAPDLLILRGNLAVTLRAQGDLHGALALQELVCEARARSSPEDDSILLTERQSLAVTRLQCGDVDGARETLEDVHRIRSETLDPDDLSLLSTHLNLGAIRWQLGDVAGAREMFEMAVEGYSRVLPAEHHDLLVARANLAIILASLGELRGARAIEEKVVEVFARTLPEDHHDLLRARHNLAVRCEEIGDLQEALEIQEQVLEVRMRVLPAAHPELLGTMLSAGSIRCALGDLDGALELHEEALRLAEETLPSLHRLVQDARGALALTLQKRGDPWGAERLQRRVLEDLSSVLPDEHPSLLVARASLAVTLGELGELHEAVDLQRGVLEVRSRTLPDTHPDLQNARQDLAINVRALGDLRGALELQRKAYTVRLQTLPDDHPSLQASRQNLANALTSIGDYHAALVLERKVHAVLSRTLPDDHADLLLVEMNLARTLDHLGRTAEAEELALRVHSIYVKTQRDDHPLLQSSRQTVAAFACSREDYERASELYGKVCEVRARTLPDDHPELQTARINLGTVHLHLGNRQGSYELQREAFEVLSEILPADHPHLHHARTNLIWASAEIGDADLVGRIVREESEAVRRIPVIGAYSSRELGDLAGTYSNAVDLLLTFAIHGFAGIEPDPALLAEALLTVETLRGIETRTVRLSRKLSPGARDERVQLLGDLRQAHAQVARLAALRFTEEGEEHEKLLRLRDEQLLLAREHRQELERRLLTLTHDSDDPSPVLPRIEDLGAWIPEGSAACSVVAYQRWCTEPEAPGPTSAEYRLAALVLKRGGSVELVDLGSSDYARSLVERYRRAVGAVAGRGVRPDESPTNSTDLEAISLELRRRIVDPVVAAVGPTAELYLSLDEFVTVVPLDALPLEDGSLVGEAVALRPLSSLLDGLDRSITPESEEVRLLVAGGIDYGESADEPGRSTDSPAWPPLPGTRVEAEALEALFEQTHAAGEVDGLTGPRVTKASLTEQAPGARYVHLATHGYFAAPPASELTARRTDSGLLVSSASEEAIAGISPLTLCGLALSNANRPVEESGQHSGILTAEELLAFDLTSCELAVLSACETSLGVERAGRGYASLHAALRGAGARWVVTSLWKVEDEATRRLMTDFYRRLWLDGTPAPRALWEAKMELRKQGLPVSEWAGWLLTGR